MNFNSYGPGYGAKPSICPSTTFDVPAVPAGDGLDTLFLSEFPGGLDFDTSQQLLAGGAENKGFGDDAPHKHSKQQAANKVSQQRYRERKKAKLHEMEDTIAQLQEKLHHLQFLQRRNHLLEGENERLEARLVGLEREIEQLKFALDTQSDRSLQPKEEVSVLSEPVPVSGWTRSGDSAALDSATAAGTVCCVPLAKDISRIDFEAWFEERMGQLRQLVDSLGLREADPFGRGVHVSVLQQVAAQVSRCCQLRQAAMRAEGSKALALFASGRTWISGVEVQEGRWGSLLQALRVSEEQREQLLLLRAEHLQKLRGIYQERQDLSLQAMALMLPRHSPLLQRDSTVEGMLSNMSSKGYLSIARSNMDLGDLLDTVKDTVRREQRAVMDLNSFAISKILTPIQAALFMALSYPDLSDVFALINALARHTGAGQAQVLEKGCATSCTLPTRRQLTEQQAQQGSDGGVSGDVEGEGCTPRSQAGEGGGPGGWAGHECCGTGAAVGRETGKTIQADFNCER